MIKLIDINKVPLRYLVEQFQNLTSLEDVKYFYHVTNLNPLNILNEGLYLIGNNIYETAIEIPDEFKENPIEYALKERGNIGYRENASIILIGIDEEEKDNLLNKTNTKPISWTNEEPPSYYIAKENILGYINTTSLELVINEEADINYCYHL
jgi:hypothetical protein